MKMQVLVVDDEFTVRQTIKLILSEKKHNIIEAENDTQAFEVLGKMKIDVVLLDINLDGISGIEILSKIRSVEPDLITIMVTVERDVSRVVECIKLGAFDYITKPFTESDLTTAIKRAKTELELRSVNNFISWEVKEQSKRFNLIGKSHIMVDLYEKLNRIGRIDTSILISGETGVGKEMVARALYRIGLRAQKPFIPVNCAALPVNLIESELFGYEAGAFTDAKEQKKGLFELANGGVIFLDEISDLSEQAQVKLLRVLQSGDFTRLGGTQLIYTDVVVYATSNQDLDRMVHAGKFRPDLYYRLNVVELKVPPLRERKDDIPLLIDHFIEKHGGELKIPIKTVNPRAISYLQNNLTWKGNVRELEHAVLRALIFSKGEQIELNDFMLPRAMKPNIQELEPFIIQQLNSIPLTKRSLEALRKIITLEISKLFDQQLIERLIKKFNGNMDAALESTGFHRTYLYTIMNRAGIKPEQWKT